MWNRKIVTASIASPVYAILLACGVTTMTGVRENGRLSGVLCDFLLMTVAYVTVSFSDHVDLWCRDLMVQ